MPTPARSQQPVEVFISFSPTDKKFLSKLEKSLAVLERQRVISVSHGGDIEAGKERARELSRLMNKAGIILLLVSSDFLASDFFYSEDFARALERHASGEAQLIPVILRPCDWEGAEFGDFAALPEGARPVTDWATQDEAFASIVKAIRSLVVDGVSISHPKKPAPALKQRIPDILPYLCNRVEQEERLSGIFSAAEPGPRRPVVCIVHGNEDECHDMYKARLKQSSLPKLLREVAPGRTPVEDIFLPFPSRVLDAEQGFSWLRDNLAEKVTGQRKAADEEIARALSQFRTPVIIHSYVSAESWEPHCPGVIDAFIKYWSAFPDLPTTHLIICLFVIYRRAGAARAQAVTPPAEPRGDGGLRARSYLDALNFRNYGAVRGGVLPEMQGVPLTDAENYFRDDKCFAEICRLHSPYFCNIQGAIEDIRSYYKGAGRAHAAGRVPMEELAKELRRVLEKNLC